VGGEPIREIETARLLLDAARYLGETLEPHRVYDRFREILADAIPHNGVVVSSYDEREKIIRCDYAWVDGELLDPEIFPPLPFKSSGGMQSEVIRSGVPLLTNEVKERVKDKGTYYDVDREGTLRRVPDEGAPKTQAAMMLPLRHEGAVVGVVQLMSEQVTYDERQLELAEAMVAQLGASVRNARLHEERRRLELAEAAALAVAAERERAALVLEAVGDGIVFVDDEGIVRFWNRAAEQITGVPGAGVRGRAVAELTPAWPTIEAAVPVASGDEHPRSVTLPIELRGRELWLSFVAVRSTGGVVYAFRDLTLERRLEETKSDFIATVSHELRTPMTAVLGAANTLLFRGKELAPEVQRQLLEMIAGQAARLAGVTESVLLASRLDRGDVALEPAPVDIDEVVRETVAALQPSLPGDATVELRLGGAGAALADRDRLQQVLVNLLDNAVKYSPDGGAIVVSSQRVEGVVRIGVTDHGRGIDDADQRRVFEKFFRGDPALRHAPSGTGLGLYICRELIDRMGGRIDVRSTPGVGSTFTVELPAA
jgi:PAS domain S-box-containing protein